LPRTALCLAPAGATTCATPRRTYVLLFRAQGESSTTWHADANATITLR
jgi:hypothetical protein